MRKRAKDLALFNPKSKAMMYKNIKSVLLDSQSKKSTLWKKYREICMAIFVLEIV